MADPQPSWKTSTLSQVWVVANGLYVSLALLCALGVIWAHLDFTIAEKVMVWATWLWSNVTSAYLTARRTSANGEAPAEPTTTTEGAKP